MNVKQFVIETLNKLKYETVITEHNLDISLEDLFFDELDIVDLVWHIELQFDATLDEFDFNLSNTSEQIIKIIEKGIHD